MTPPDLQRVRHIWEYCDEIEKTMDRYGRSFEIFDRDADYQRSLAFSILQIGELSGGLSEEYRAATGDRVQWRAMKGMRNLVAHHYGAVDRRVVWETVLTDIPNLKEFCQ